MTLTPGFSSHLQIPTDRFTALVTVEASERGTRHEGKAQIIAEAYPELTPEEELSIVQGVALELHARVSWIDDDWSIVQMGKYTQRRLAVHTT